MYIQSVLKRNRVALMTTQAELIAEHRKSLNDVFKAKFPDGKFTVNTRYLTYTGSDLYYTRVVISHETYRSTHNTGYPAATLILEFPASSDRRAEDWSSLEPICPTTWYKCTPFFRIRYRTDNESPCISADDFCLGLADKKSTFNSLDACLAALRRRGAGSKVLALAKDTLIVSKDELSNFLNQYYH